MIKKSKNVLLGVTGSIAAFKAADLIRSLQEFSCTVTVVMTREAEAFITPLTLATLSGRPVHRGMLEDAHTAWAMPHLSLAREADAVVIAPATANVIAKLAHGIADDLLTCTVISTRAPVLIAPAMHTEMYENKIVQENCRRLKSLGMRFVGPVKGKLACGTTGMGHLAELDDIVQAVRQVI